MLPALGLSLPMLPASVNGGSPLRLFSDVQRLAGANHLTTHGAFNHSADARLRRQRKIGNLNLAR
jgi:hypothetical protein